MRPSVAQTTTTTTTTTITYSGCGIARLHNSGSSNGGNSHRGGDLGNGWRLTRYSRVTARGHEHSFKVYNIPAALGEEALWGGTLDPSVGNGLYRSRRDGSISTSSDLLRVPGDASANGRAGNPSNASLNDMY